MGGHEQQSVAVWLVVSAPLLGFASVDENIVACLFDSLATRDIEQCFTNLEAAQ